MIVVDFEQRPRCDAQLGDMQRGFRQCGMRGTGAESCRLCERLAIYCDAHQAEARALLGGHALLMHPESVPEVLAMIAADPDRLALLKARAQVEPEQYRAVLELLRRDHGV